MSGRLASLVVNTSMSSTDTTTTISASGKFTYRSGTYGWTVDGYVKIGGNQHNYNNIKTSTAGGSFSTPTFSNSYPRTHVAQSVVVKVYGYCDEDTSSNVTATKTITIPAKTNYPITLVNVGETTTETKWFGETLSLPTPTREGYKFMGWSDGTTNYGTTYNKDAAATLTAEWQATISYDVTLVDGSSVTTIQKYYGETLKLPVPTKSYSIFGGWKDAEGHNYGTEYDKNEEITLYAVWNSTAWKVRWSNEGDTNYVGTFLYDGEEIGIFPSGVADVYEVIDENTNNSIPFTKQFNQAGDVISLLLNWDSQDGELPLGPFKINYEFRGANKLQEIDRLATRDGVEWYAILGPFTEYLEDHKIYSKMDMRVKKADNASIKFYIKIDEGEWEECNLGVSSTNLCYHQTIVPRRCHEFSIKIVGTGDVRIDSLRRKFRKGTEGDL